MSSPGVATLARVRSPRRFGWQRLGGRFLVLSILAHVIFGTIAAYLVVQTIQARHKLDFQSGPKGPTTSTRALEHKVQMKKQNAMSAPPQVRRVTTTGISKVALPDMPAMPSMTAVLTPSAISGMGSAGVAPGGFGGGGGMGGNGGKAINFFGARTGSPGLSGTIYDLKQDRARKPTGMTPERYQTIISQFARSGFNEGILSTYFKGEKPLFTTQVFAPRIDANGGPEAFGLADIVQPRMWCVLYKGKVTAPEAGAFHFVGVGDDVLIVRFDGRLVLDNGSSPFSDWRPKRKYIYHYAHEAWYDDRGHAVGDKMEVSAGSSHNIEVLIGEQPGGICQFSLFLEKEGTEYGKDEKGNPILPIFRMADIKTQAPAGDTAPPFAAGGPIWKVEAASTASVFGAAR